MSTSAEMLTCFGGPCDGRTVGVLAREKEVELTTALQRVVKVVTNHSTGAMTETYRVRCVYRRGTSPRSGKACLVYVRADLC